MIHWIELLLLQKLTSTVVATSESVSHLPPLQSITTPLRVFIFYYLFYYFVVHESTTTSRPPRVFAFFLFLLILLSFYVSF